MTDHRIAATTTWGPDVPCPHCDGRPLIPAPYWTKHLTRHHPETPMPEPTPAEHCGHLSPQTLLTTPPVECVLRPGHSGSHASETNMRWYPTPAPVPPPAGVRDQIAAAIRDATCTGDCGKTEDECARERIQPFAWHHGKLAVVEGTPEQFADAVLRVPAIAEALTAVAVLARVREWSDGPCPTRPAPFEITGDRARGYVQAMDEIAQLLAGHGPLALDPQEQP